MFRSPVARHGLARDDTVVATAVVGQGADLAVITTAVGFRADLVAVFLDGATITMALGGADDVDDVSGFEHIAG